MSATTKAAPAELYDLDLGEEHWLRADLYPTRGKALAAAARELDAPFTELRAGRVWCRVDPEYVAEMEADGIKEPYDGWPWTPAAEGDEGAVEFWHVWIRRQSHSHPNPESRATEREDVDPNEGAAASSS